METDRYRITGALRLPRDGYRSRLSDYLNSAERDFLPLTDVEITPLTGNGGSRKQSFAVVAVRHIVLAMPAEGGDGEEG